MPLEQANEIQLKMYNFIERYMKSEGMPPTNREIGREMQIPSTGHVDYHLTMLEKKGLITRQVKKSRGIKLAKQNAGIPVMGTIAAGEPIDIFRDPSVAFDLGHNSVDAENSYALIVRGRSMIEDHICDGDYVIIKPQSMCQNGDIVVAVHMEEAQSSSATLKRFFQENDHDRIRLQPANSELEPILIPKSIWDREWQIQGKVVAIFRQPQNSDGNVLPDKASSAQKVQSENETDIKMMMKAMKEATDRLNDLVEQKATESEKLKGQEATNLSLGNMELSTQTRDDEIVSTAKTVVGLAAQQEAAYEGISTATKNTREQLNQIQTQCTNQAKSWYIGSLIAAVFSFFIIISGAFIVLNSGNNAGVLTSIASIIPGAASALFFLQAKDANKRLDEFYKKLIEIEEVNRAVELTFTTPDEIQDRYKGLIIFKLLGLRSKEQEIPLMDLLTIKQETHNLTLVKESRREHK